MFIRNRIASTPTANVTPLAYQAVQATACHAQIHSLVESKLGASYANFFAEPQQSATGSEIDWYANVSGQAVRLNELPEQEKQATLATITDIAGKITELANTLKSAGDSNSLMAGALLELALSYPSTDCIYLIGSQPVLTLWGYNPAGVTASPEPLTRLAAAHVASIPSFPAAQVEPAEAVQPAAPITETIADKPKEPVVQPTAAKTISFAWLMPFLLSLLVCFGMLWLLTSGILGGFSLLPSSCSRTVAPVGTPQEQAPAVVPADLSAALASTASLQAELSRLQTEYLAKLQGCPLAQPPIPPAAVPEVQPVPVPVPVVPEVVPVPVVPEVVPVPEVPPVVPQGPLAQLDDMPLPPPLPVPEDTPPVEPKQTPTPETKPEKKPEKPTPPKQKLGEKMVIPDDAKKSKNLSFLEGCWLADTGKGIVNEATGLPNAIKFCFDKNGKGVNYVQEHNAQHKLMNECSGGANAVMSDDGVLLIDNGGSVVCPDGTRYLAERVQCKDQGGVAICTETLRRKWKTVPFVKTTR